MDTELLKKLFEHVSAAKSLTKTVPARDWTPEYRALSDEVSNAYHAALEAGIHRI